MAETAYGLAERNTITYSAVVLRIFARMAWSACLRYRRSSCYWCWKLLAEMPLEKESLMTRISASVHVLHIDQVVCDASSYYPNSCFILIYTARCGNRTHLTQVFFAILFLSFLAPALALSCVSWLSSLSGPCFLLKVLCFSLMLLLVRLVSSVALLSSAGNGWFGAARCLRPRGGRQSRGASVFAALLLC